MNKQEQRIAQKLFISAILFGLFALILNSWFMVPAVICAIICTDIAGLN